MPAGGFLLSARCYSGTRKLASVPMPEKTSDKLCTIGIDIAGRPPGTGRN